jgi:phosphatidylserine/phosphatidylglycerophosphate/cardiolipin synthase-like enzyme
MAVTGPANYTLAIFRADSWNANLPAIFLDPDLRSQTPPSLADAFSAAEMALPSDEPVTSALKKFNVLKNQYQAGTLNPHSQNWSQLQTEAHASASDKTLDTSCRIVAAYIEWRSAERCPLHNGAIETAFREYVALKYGVS